MAIINIEYDNNFKAKQKYGASIVQYSKNVDTIRIKFDFEFKSSTPAVFLYAERNDRRVNEVFSTQVLRNVSTGQYEYVLGSSDGDEKSSWFSAVPGPLKVSLRIVDGEAQYSTDIYSIFVMMSNNSSTEEVTFGVDQFNNLLNFIQNAADLKLNIKDYNIFDMGILEINEADIVKLAFQEKEKDYDKEIFKYKTTTPGGYVEGIIFVGNDFSSMWALRVSGNGIASYRVDTTINNPELAVEGVNINKISSTYIDVLGTIETSNLRINSSTYVPYPTSTENAVNLYFLTNNYYTKTDINNNLNLLKSDLIYQINQSVTTSKNYTDLKYNELKSLYDALVEDAPELYNTFKEIANYIASDKSGASEMLSKINNNTSEINVIKQGLPETVDIILRSEVSPDTTDEVKEIEINGAKFKFAGSGTGDSSTNNSSTSSRQVVTWLELINSSTHVYIETDEDNVVTLDISEFDLSNKTLKINLNEPYYENDDPIWFGLRKQLNINSQEPYVINIKFRSAPNGEIILISNYESIDPYCLDQNVEIQFEDKEARQFYVGMADGVTGASVKKFSYSYVMFYLGNNAKFIINNQEDDEILAVKYYHDFEV